MIRLERISSAASKAFAAPLSQLHQACFPEDPWPRPTIAALMVMPGFFGRLAWFDEAASGLAFAQGVGEDCELLSLGVLPEQRRRGIGSALLAGILGDALERGASRIFLEVADGNIAARALYAAHGFVQIGRRANYYRHSSGVGDALVLRLLLST